VNDYSDYLIIGKVLRPFGIKGETKVLPITDDAVRFRDVGHVFLKDGSGYRRSAVEQVKMSGNRVILKLASVSSRDEAEALRNRLLYIDRQHAAPLDESSHYYYDILGCTVKSVQGQVIGRVHDIQNAGSCDVYVVKAEQPSEGEILVPAVHDVVKKIDTKNREIHIEIIDGLL
jgi:16S rRNA processing protein RimM